MADLQVMEASLRLRLAEKTGGGAFQLRKTFKYFDKDGEQRAPQSGLTLSTPATIAACHHRPFDPSHVLVSLPPPRSLLPPPCLPEPSLCLPSRPHPAASAAQTLSL